MNVIASPAPTSTLRHDGCRDRVADRERDLAGCHQQATGHQHPAGADPVDEHADRHLQGRVDASCMTLNSARTPALAWNRSWAATPVTPSELRLNTAMT